MFALHFALTRHLKSLSDNGQQRPQCHGSCREGETSPQQPREENQAFKHSQAIEQVVKQLYARRSVATPLLARPWRGHRQAQAPAPPYYGQHRLPAGEAERLCAQCEQCVSESRTQACGPFMVRGLRALGHGGRVEALFVH